MLAILRKNVNICTQKPKSKPKTKSPCAGNVWHVKLEPNITNGLTKPSVVDTLQLRGIDTQRFVRKLGEYAAELRDYIPEGIIC